MNLVSVSPAEPALLENLVRRRWLGACAAMAFAWPLGRWLIGPEWSNSAGVLSLPRGEDSVENTTPRFDGDWPCFLGPRGESRSDERGLDWAWPASGPRRAWLIPCGEGYSSPVASQGRVILFHRQGDEERLDALELETGSVIWSVSSPTTYRCRYSYSSGPYSTPTIADGRVFALGAQGRLLCVDFNTGELLWHRELHHEYQVDEGLFGAGSSPFVEHGRIIFNLGGVRTGAGIIALDCQTGATLWTATNHAAGYATARQATIKGRSLLVCLTDDHCVGLDPTDGRVDWMFPFKSKMPDSCNATSPLIVDDLVLLTTGPGWGAVCLQMLPAGGYRELWRDRRVIDSTWNNLVHDAGMVYGFSSKRGQASLRCLELTTGRLRWQHESELERGALLAVEGRLIVLGELGHLAVVEMNADEPRIQALTAEPVMASPCFSAPALHRGRLLLRNGEYLAAYDLRPSAV